MKKLTCIAIAAFLFATGANAQDLTKIDINEGGENGVHFESDAAVTGSYVIFEGNDGENNFEPWVSHPESGMTQMLKDINATGDSNPENFFAIGDTVFFSADDGQHGAELWMTDGTTEGTHLVKDIWPGAKSSMENGTFYQFQIHSVNPGVVVFTAENATQGKELFRSDGTMDGTYILKDIWPGETGSSPEEFVVMDGILYFKADDGDNGTELWRTDGTADGTYMVKDVLDSFWFSSSLGELTATDLQVFFHADGGDVAVGQELWVSDGTDEGTHLVKDITDGSGVTYWVANPVFIPYGDNLIFTTTVNTNTLEIWFSDGTEEGTYVLLELGAFLTNEIYGWTEYKGKIYFQVVAPNSNSGLWVTDGTKDGTQKVVDVKTVPAVIHQDIVTIGENMLMSAISSGAGDAFTSVYITDGTDAGTMKISDADDAIFFGAVGDKMYYSAQDDSGRELWVLQFELTSAIRELSSAEITMFPNPTTGQIQFKGHDVIGLEHVAIYDMLGRLVYQSKYFGDTIELPSGLANGTYAVFLRAESGELYQQEVVLIRN